MNKFFLGFIFLMAQMISFAQDATGATAPLMADAFREQGKIYVVISVISIVFLCLILFLVRIERKLKKLENDLNSKSPSTND